MLRRPEPEITREEVNWIMSYLMQIDAKVTLLVDGLLDEEDDDPDE